METLTTINYRGWPESYLLSNEQAEVIIVPKVGRIMQFRFKGGENVFWENPQLWGKEPNPKTEDVFFNVGGDKTWPAPQSVWTQITHRPWPPPNTFNTVPLATSINKNQVILSSPIDPFYGIKFERYIVLDRHQPKMTVTTTYEKIEGQPVEVSIWIITQLCDPVAVQVILPQSSIFPDGYHLQWEGQPAKLKRENDLLSFIRDPDQSHKIGSDASSLIWLGKETTLRMDCSRVLAAIYPDNNSSTEVYTNADPDAPYVEFEFLSPLQTLQVGDKMNSTITYNLE